MKICFALVLLTGFSLLGFAQEDKTASKELVFELPSAVYGNPQVTCRFAYPVDERGNPTDSASDIVWFFPYPTQREYQKSGVYADLIKSGKVSVGAIFFTTGNDVQVTDLDKHYYYPQSKSNQTICDALASIREKLGLKKRKIMVVGESGGGSAAEQFAVSNSEIVQAAAFVGGRRFAMPRDNKCYWLVLHTFGDDLKDENEVLVQKLTSLNAEYIFLKTPPEWPRRFNPGSLFHHVPNEDSRRLLVQYLLGMVNLRKSNGYEIPARESWNAKWNVTKKDVVTFPASKVVYCPSFEFKSEYLSVPQDFEPGNIEGKDELSYTVARCPPALQAQGLVIYQVDENEEMVFETNWDLEYLAVTGFDAVAIDRRILETGANLEKVIKPLGSYSKGKDCVFVAFSPRPSDVFAKVPIDRQSGLKCKMMFDVWSDGWNEIGGLSKDKKSKVKTALFVDEDFSIGAGYSKFQAEIAKQKDMLIVKEKLSGQDFGKIHQLRMEQVVKAFVAKGEPAPQSKDKK